MNIKERKRKLCPLKNSVNSPGSTAHFNKTKVIMPFTKLSTIPGQRPLLSLSQSLILWGYAGYQPGIFLLLQEPVSK